MAKQTFYSNGKLFITGEYVVLDGAEAFALPTIFGQDLTVDVGQNREIFWKSFDSDNAVWFEDTIGFDEILKEKDPDEIDSVRNTLIGILREAAKLNPEFLSSDGFTIETRLTFPRHWGLGTSSTLINNVAEWLDIDAFTLLWNSFGGSGYDIACAQNDTPIVYRLADGKPTVRSVNFYPAYAENLYFVYLNRKQSSKAAIAAYYNNRMEDLQDYIKIIDSITEKAIAAENAGMFARAIENHESILSDIIQMKTVKESFFADFDGAIKSLGGWGGDFVLAVSHADPSDYFRAKGFDTIIPYRDMILPK